MCGDLDDAVFGIKKYAIKQIQPTAGYQKASKFMLAIASKLERCLYGSDSGDDNSDISLEDSEESEK